MSRIVQTVFHRPAEQTDMKSKVAIGKRIRLKNLRCALALHGFFGMEGPPYCYLIASYIGISTIFYFDLSNRFIDKRPVLMARCAIAFLARELRDSRFQGRSDSASWPSGAPREYLYLGERCR
jgi:hypothetical protein